MERLLRFLNDQRELGAPDDALSRQIDAVLSGIQSSDSGSLDEDELELIQAATGRPYQQMNAPQGLDGAGQLFASARNKDQGR